MTGTLRQQSNSLKLYTLKPSENSATCTDWSTSIANSTELQNVNQNDTWQGNSDALASSLFALLSLFPANTSNLRWIVGQIQEQAHVVHGPVFLKVRFEKPSSFHVHLNHNIKASVPDQILASFRSKHLITNP